MPKLANEGGRLAFIATNDLTGKAGYVIGLDTSNANQVVLANAQTIPQIGILDEEGVANEPVSVRLSTAQGTATGIYGGTVNIGDKLTSDASGKLITTTTSGDRIVARAKEAGASGEYHEVILEAGYVH